MKQLPEDFDAQMFVGLTVVQISVNANQLLFHFDSEVLLVVEYAVHLTTVASARVAVPPPPLRIEVPEFDPRILALIEQRCTAAEALRDCTLIIRFQTGDVLEVLADIPMYESYRIYHEGRELIV